MSFHECQKANFESYDPPVRSLRRQIWSQAPAAITQLPHDIHVGVCRDAHWCRRWRFLAAKFWEIMAGFATDLRGHIFCLLLCSRCTFFGMIELTLIINFFPKLEFHLLEIEKFQQIDKTKFHLRNMTWLQLLLCWSIRLVQIWFLLNWHDR